MEHMHRVFAYAYSKTGNTRDAEDLSQDILMELLRSDSSRARNEEAWLYGICRHVWSRYLRRNKPHWEETSASPAIDFLSSGEDVELDTVQSLEYERLRREIAYLSRTRREVLVMYYFEGRSVEDIAVNLHVSESTVRWHMSRARSDLKERLEMENRDGMREKVKLLVSAAGELKDSTICGLRTELLTQNIAWICYGKQRTIEDISRELGVPAVYIENIVKRLTDMDYLTEIAGRYSTNFFIWNEEYQLAHLRYYRDNVPELVVSFYEIAKKNLPEIRNIGFVGSDMPDSELAWHIVPDIADMVWRNAISDTKINMKLEYEVPIRSDGSRHWVIARVPVESRIDDSLKELITGAMLGIKGSSTQPVDGVEYKFVIVGERDGFQADLISKLKYIVRGEYGMLDREYIAMLARDGLIEVRDGVYRVCVPYMTRRQHDEYMSILSDSISIELKQMIYAKFEGYARDMLRRLPKFIDKNERNMRMMGFENFAPILYYLIKMMADKHKRISAIVWEN